MRKLLNTLYVTSENSYLSLDGENVVVLEEKTESRPRAVSQFGRNCFFWLSGNKSGVNGGMCGEEYFSVLLTPQGKFLARVTGKTKGNVILREQQYASAKNEDHSLEIAKNCILGKVYNARWVLERAARDHAFRWMWKE